jgi:hypothetical protein
MTVHSAALRALWRRGAVAAALVTVAIVAVATAGETNSSNPGALTPG